MLLSALLIGLAGGMHCSIMCGPLQSAVLGKQKLTTSTLLYQSGRILTYIIIGSVFFSIGESINLLGVQEAFVYLIIFYVIYFYILPSKWRRTKWVHKIETLPFNFFRKRLKNKTNKKSSSARLLTGMLNGLLPCGLVYMAAANSLLAPSIFIAMLSMVFFGIGTMPWLLGSSYIIQVPMQFFKKRATKLKPILATVVVLFLLLRIVPNPMTHEPVTDNQNDPFKEITICNGF